MNTIGVSASTAEEAGKKLDILLASMSRQSGVIITGARITLEIEEIRTALTREAVRSDISYVGEVTYTAAC